MHNSYVKTPESIKFSDISVNEYRLSAKSYRLIHIANKNVEVISSLLASNPISGYEVGSLAYVGNSDFYFLRTKAIQDDSFTLDFETNGALQPIKPFDFSKTNKTKKGLKHGDILFVTGGNVGAVIFVDKDYPNFVFSSHILKLNFINNNFYAYAILKHNIAKEQANFAPEGAIKGLDTFKLNFLLDIKIPFPNHNAENTIQFIELLTQAIINKEQLIKERHESILQLIETELLTNQKPNQFKFELPTINEIENVGRLDTNLYCEQFKKVVFQIENYINGYQNIQDWGFTLSRGQNLQVSNIGDSIYSKEKYKNFYTLMLPKFLSKYGTVDKVEYLGNPNALKTLLKGDLIFGAEGFEKGRSVVIIEEQDRVITNIHGITIQQEEHNVNKAIFVKCCLDYLRSKGLIDLYAVGGNGGSLAQKYWDIIPFPKFEKSKQDEIAILYHNPVSVYQADAFTLDNFLVQDNAFNETAGIYELDKTAKQLKEILNKAIDNIANDREVEIYFK
jgi:hypothetical protein